MVGTMAAAESFHGGLYKVFPSARTCTDRCGTDQGRAKANTVRSGVVLDNTASGVTACCALLALLSISSGSWIVASGRNSISILVRRFDSNPDITRRPGVGADPCGSLLCDELQHLRRYSKQWITGGIGQTRI